MKRLTVFGFLLLTSFLATAQIPTAGLVAFYPFQGNTLDSTVNNYNAQAFGCSYTTDRFGNAASAIALNGTSDSIHLPVPNFFPATGDFAISMWMKSPFQRRQHVLNVGDYTGSTNDNFQISLNSGVAAYTYWNGAGGNQALGGQPSQLCDEKWHHVVVSRRSDTLYMWLDKRLVAATYFNQSIGVNQVAVCGNSAFPFQGAIDDVAFYATGMTANTIDALYHDHQPIVLLSPRGTDKYPLNTPCSIEWRVASSITQVHLDYSTDGGMTWNNIATNVPASTGLYVWPMNFPLGTSVTVRLSDAQQANTFLQSGTFGMSEYHWDLVNNQCAFSNRDGAGLLSFNNKLWLIGGWDSSDPNLAPGYTLSDVWSSVDGATWVRDTVAPWAPRHTSGWLVYDGKMWVIGGDGNSGYLIHDVWNTTDGVTWNLVEDSLPMPERMTHMTAVMNGKMYILGGQLIPGVGSPYDVVYNDVWESTDGTNWTQVTANAPWSPRAQLENHCVDSTQTMWMLGGGTYYDRHYYNDIWKTTDGANWTKVMDCAPWPGRQYSEMAFFDNRMWVLDGYDGDGNRDDVWYSDDGTNWFELRNTPWPERHAASVCVHDSSLWMVAGNLWNDSWRLRKISVPLSVSTTTPAPTLSLAPNPAHTTLTITAAQPIGAFKILDAQGKCIITQVCTNTATTVNVSHLAAGTYYIQTQNCTQKFIKQ